MRNVCGNWKLAKMENVVIDLLWLRPGKVGGTESYIRNLLDGFMELADEFHFTLLVSKDNAETFRKYESDVRYQLLTANINSAGILGRILWQNFHQNRFLRKNGFQKCFEPVYCKPWLNGGIDYICVIHDLQAYHYPQYHPLHEVVYSRICWRMDVLTAFRIIAISNWVKKDVQEKYRRKDIEVIYNPILVKKEDVVDFRMLHDRFGIEQRQYFYTVSQMIPHKNLSTLIRVIEKIICSKEQLPGKLVISGVNGNAAVELKRLINAKKLKDHIILTGYINNKERNTLYKYCHTFLFPSIFEGFGMPPIEAMFYGARVVTTKCASIPEVTQEKAIYVNDAYDADEWIKKIKSDGNVGKVDFEIYAPKNISQKYLQILREPVWKKR